MIRRSRESLAKHIASMGIAEAKELADFVMGKGANDATPCWGAIAERVSKSLNDDASLEALWKSMVEAGDPRPQLVLLSILKDRPTLVEMATRDEAKVPAVVRQALKAIREPNDVEANRGFETRVNELLAFRYFVPDSIDPLRESQRRRK